jgi:CBS domain-containing protein
MRCSEIMRRDVTIIREDDDVLAAARAMREKDVGFLPVVDARGVVAGVLTDRDIVVRGCLDDAPLSQRSIAGVMTRGAIVCGPDEPVGAAAARMRFHRFTRIVIVDEMQRPIGVLSLSDLAQYENPSRTGRTLRRIAERKYVPERP